MISVVLYGRNDSHGYNLHKRAAISLNCIAEVLDGPDDEIIFVDYNSPDQIPTFPEAIADTLTEKASKLLRIIRVREAYHRQFNGKTHLVALESQSRNIAIRRANPKNRWILSTNTDMIFIPRHSGSSLTAGIAELADGFYHLPRFEIPEILWETLDRRNPAVSMQRVSTWGRTLHLNEIVYGGYDNVYEAPGDFQLFLRDDLNRIGGFDETMIRGWHVDSNIARRMKLLRGEVLSGVDRFFGYHCGHTRQATALHRSGFVANSLDTYVNDVVDPVLYAQLENWGAPGITFEERRIPHGHISVVERALAQAITTEGPETSEVILNDTSFDLNTYEPSHILPHLLNLLGEMPDGQSLLLIGEDRDLFSQLSVTFENAGIDRRLLWADGDAKCIFAEPVKLLDGLKVAHIILLQFPAYQNARTDQWTTARWHAQKAFEEIITAECTRPLDQRRLIVLVNAAHTPFQDSFQPAMSFNAIPYTTRLRHGFITLPSTETDSYKCMPQDYVLPFLDDDLAMVRQLLGQHEAVPGWERLALELPDMINAAAIDPNADGVDALLRSAWQHVQSSASRCIEPPVSVLGRDVTASRLCSTTDWENTAWLAQTDRCFRGNAPYAQGARSRWIWERSSLLFNLRHHLDEHERPWVLVVTSGPDCLPTLVGHYGYRVAYTSYADLVSAQPTHPARWEKALKIWHMISHAEIIPLHEAQAKGVTAFAAILMAGTDISAAGPGRFEQVAAQLASLAAPEAYFAAAVMVHLNAGSGGALTFADWKSAYDPGKLVARMGMRSAGAWDARIPVDCAVRYALEDSTHYVPGLSFGWGDAMVTIGILDAKFAGAPITRPSAIDRAVTAMPDETDGIAIRDADLSPSPDTTIPETVVVAAHKMATESFGCRIISGLSRDLSQFQKQICDHDGLTWWAVAVDVNANHSLHIRADPPAAPIAIYANSRIVMINSADSKEDNALVLDPISSEDSRQVLLCHTIGNRKPELWVS